MRSNKTSHDSEKTFGVAKRNIRHGDSIQIEIVLRTVNGKQTATMFSPDFELTELAKSLLLNWLRLKHGSELPDGICVISNISNIRIGRSF